MLAACKRSSIQAGLNCGLVPCDAPMIRRGYPGLEIEDVQGNVGARLRKLDSVEEGYDALILAEAGVLRVGLGERIASWVGRE